VLGALLELAGEKAQAVNRFRTSRWTSPGKSRWPFDGCSSKGPDQTGPGATHSFRENRKGACRGQVRRYSKEYHHERTRQFPFRLYPYICLTVFLLGSLIRFDRDQYTWKSDSSQLLQGRPAALGQQPVPRRRSVPVLWPLCRHVDAAFRVRALHQRRHQAALAMVAGGMAGVLGFIGVSLLLHRRLSDPRIRINSKTSDIVLLVLLWLQLALGLATCRCRRSTSTAA
jgi:hypothetical protein